MSVAHKADLKRKCFSKLPTSARFRRRPPASETERIKLEPGEDDIKVGISCLSLRKVQFNLLLFMLFIEFSMSDELLI